MKPSCDVKYLQANAAKIIRAFEHDLSTLIITQDGEAKAILQDVRTYEDTQETLSLLRILASGAEDIQCGNLKTVSNAFEAARLGSTKSAW